MAEELDRYGWGGWSQLTLAELSLIRPGDVRCGVCGAVAQGHVPRSPGIPEHECVCCVAHCGLAALWRRYGSRGRWPRPTGRTMRAR